MVEYEIVPQALALSEKKIYQIQIWFRIVRVTVYVIQLTNRALSSFYTHAHTHL